MLVKGATGRKTNRPIRHQIMYNNPKDSPRDGGRWNCLKQRTTLAELSDECNQKHGHGSFGGGDIRELQGVMMNY